MSSLFDTLDQESYNIYNILALDIYFRKSCINKCSDSSIIEVQFPCPGNYERHRQTDRPTDQTTNQPTDMMVDKGDNFRTYCYLRTLI